MSLISEIIRDAYRESNLVAIGAEPTTEEYEEGLRLLNRLIDSVYGQEAGEDLIDIPIGRNEISRPSGFPWYEQVPDKGVWFVPENVRLILNLTSSAEVFLHPMPNDGARLEVIDVSESTSTAPLTLFGNGRKIDGLDSVVINTDGERLSLFYRAETGSWHTVTPLGLTDTFPFPRKFETLFVIGLCMRINPRHGTVITGESIAEFDRLMRAFKAKYRQHKEVPSELAYIKTLGVRHDYRGWGDSEAAFNAGYPFAFYRRSWR